MLIRVTSCCRTAETSLTTDPVSKISMPLQNTTLVTPSISRERQVAELDAFASLLSVHARYGSFGLEHRFLWGTWAASTQEDDYGWASGPERLLRLGLLFFVLIVVSSTPLISLARYGKQTSCELPVGASVPCKTLVQWMLPPATRALRHVAHAWMCMSRLMYFAIRDF